MEKGRSARPADATQVLGYLAAISAGADRRRPAQEVDRQTLVAGQTLPRPAARTFEADRATRLVPTVARVPPPQARAARVPPPQGRPAQPPVPRAFTRAPDPPKAGSPRRRPRWLDAFLRLMRNG
jgi:hypothetical protein